MIQRLKQIFNTLQTSVKQHPIRTSILGSAVLVVAGLVGFYTPKTVEFMYADQTCVGELTVLPGLHRQATDSNYNIEFAEPLEVGGLALAARSVCFTPQLAPEPGDVKIATTLWGSWLALPQLYNLQIGSEPRVNARVFEQPVATTKPVMVELDQPDALHDYQLIVSDKSVSCVDAETAKMSCDIKDLELDQGEQYQYQLTKQYSQTGSEPVSSGTLQTLKAVRITKSSVKQDQTVYSKPTEFRFKADKPLAAAEASLTSGDTTTDIEVSLADKTITITARDELQRPADYLLTLDNVEAKDGSTVTEPYQLKFTMSGGPKVTNVSIGKSRVSPDARVILTFDQALSDEQDLSGLVAVKGGQATVYRTSDRQLAVQLGGLGRCQTFTIVVSKGLASKYGIKSQQSWQYDSRTTCYTTKVYGTSLQGRSLVAYQFGDRGPVTLYTGAIHGNEASSMYMMQAWIAELDANPGKLDGRRVVVIPSINPDGVAAGTRNNSRDVNLSRNFPTDNWQSDIDDTDGENQGGGGKKPLSEPAAAALASYTKQLNPRLLVSYHAIGSLVIGDAVGSYSGDRADRYARMVGYRNATGQGGTFDYAITGSYEDWTWRNQAIPSMVVELGSYSYYNFGHHRAAMWSVLD